MKNFIPFIILCYVAMGCNKNKIKELELQVFQLEEELLDKVSTIDRQEEEIMNLKKELKVKNEIINKRSQVKQYSDNEIIDIVKKDREYYCPNAKRKNFVVRNINTNIYDVRFDFMALGVFSSKTWSSNVYRIQFFPDDKYNLKMRKGEPCI